MKKKDTVDTLGIVEENRKYPAFAYRDFRIYWFGQLVSNIGSQMQLVALNYQIYVLTHSAFALGLIGFSRFVPIVFCSLLGGAFADTHNRKRILFITQSTLGVVALILAFLTYTHEITATWIYLLTVIAAIAMAFDGPVRQAVVPALVEKKDLTNAMSLSSIMWQSAQIAGQALSGFVIAAFGIGSVYAVNAVSFISVLAALIFMHYDGEIEGVPSGISWQAVREGLSFVRHRTIIWSTMLLDFFCTFFASATTMLPIFARDILKVGPQGLGFLYAAPSVGAVVTGFVIAHRGHIKKEGKVLLSAVTLFGFATILFGLSKSFVLSFVALFLVGAGDSISTIIRNTIRQIATPDYIRGRMTSVNMIFFMGGPQLGEFEAGVLAATVGAPLSVAIGGIGTLIVVGAVAWGIPTLRNYEGVKH